MRTQRILRSIDVGVVASCWMMVQNNEQLCVLLNCVTSTEDLK